MGCSQSKIENEEAVSRCKERKHLMKNAVSSRNAFSASHSSYSVSLRHTGAALHDFVIGEASSTSGVGSITTASPLVGPTSVQSTLLPPPPPVPDPDIAPLPLHRAMSMPEFAVSKVGVNKTQTTIVEEDEVDEEEEEGLKLRRSKREVIDVGVDPPPPPEIVVEENRDPPPPEPVVEGGSSWDYFFNVEDVPSGSLDGVEVNAHKVLDEMSERKKREIGEKKRFDEMPERNGTRENGGNGREVESHQVFAEMPKRKERREASADKVVDEMPKRKSVSGDEKGGVEKVGPESLDGGKGVKKGKEVVGASGSGSGSGSVSGGEAKKRNSNVSVSLVHVFTELDDCFLAASESAREASKLLEATRLHYHSNFVDNNGHMDHSERLMRAITWNRSFAGLGDVKDVVESEEKNETHATVLDKLLAWEKKLYDEVKAGEIMKFEYQRKLASLNKQKKHSSNSEALEKIKASFSHLHTRYIVDMQSMDATVSEINRLRDERLYPKLVALVEELAKMWEVMQGFHQKQLSISALLRSVDISQSAKETTDDHHQRTYQLRSVVGEWHSQFDYMVKYQKEYIRTLNSWLKLNLIPIESNIKEKVSSPPRPQNPPIQYLLITWHDLLVKLPDEHAKSAIHNFAAVLHTIFEQQDDELKLRAKMEESTRDLEKKQRQYNRWVREYMQKKMANDEMEAHTGEDGFVQDEIMVQKEIVVETAKTKLEEDKESYQRQCIHVREKTLTSLKTRLPELFRSLSDFAHSSSEMYRSLKAISDSQRHKRGEPAA